MSFPKWNRSIGVLALGFAAFVAVTAAAQNRGAAPAAPAQGAAPSQQGAAPSQQGAAPSQQGAAAANPAPNPNATGVVAFQPTDGMNTRRLRFEAGARTNWHTHTEAQMIWAEEGRGLYQMMGEPVKELRKDVPVLLKANVPHWHGAAPDSYVVQLTIYGGDIKWGAPVTDAEFLGRK
jgi:quercetin dioxygenase-like cupin family protein